MDKLDRLERDVVAQIHEMQMRHEQELEPLLKTLADIRALRPRTYVLHGQTFIEVQPPMASAKEQGDG